jgi:hypothetical protein
MEWGNNQLKALAIATGIMGSVVLLLGIRLQGQAQNEVFMAEIDFQEPTPPPSPEPEIQLAEPAPEAPEPTTLQAFNTEEKETKASAPEKSQAQADFEQAEKAMWAQGPIGADYALKLKAIQKPDVLEEVDPEQLTERCTTSRKTPGFGTVWSGVCTDISLYPFIYAPQEAKSRCASKSMKKDRW